MGYLGLTPSESSTGDSVKRGGITKAGNGRTRRILVEAAWAEVTLKGRFGVVLSRLDGPTLLQLSRTGAVTFGQAGAILATLALTVHKTPPPAGKREPLPSRPPGTMIQRTFDSKFY